MQLSAKCENDRFYQDESFKHDSLQTTKGEWPLKKSVHFIFIICVVLRNDGRLLLQKGSVGTAIRDVTNVLRNADYMWSKRACGMKEEVSYIPAEEYMTAQCCFVFYLCHELNVVLQ